MKSVVNRDSQAELRQFNASHMWCMKTWKSYIYYIYNLQNSALRKTYVVILPIYIRKCLFNAVIHRTDVIFIYKWKKKSSIDVYSKEKILMILWNRFCFYQLKNIKHIIYIKVKITSFDRDTFSYSAVQPPFGINFTWSLDYIK